MIIFLNFIIFIIKMKSLCHFITNFPILYQKIKKLYSLY